MTTTRRHGQTERGAVSVTQGAVSRAEPVAMVQTRSWMIVLPSSFDLFSNGRNEGTVASRGATPTLEVESR